MWGRAQPLAVSAPPARAEVVIIGGGFTGISLLMWLRSAGVDAHLVERQHLAWGASGRNAGFLLAGVADNYARAVSRYGRGVAGEVWTFTLENHDLVAGSAAAPAANHRRTGSWTTAMDAQEAASLEESATLLGEDGLPGELQKDRHRPGLVRLLNAADGEVDPVRLVAALAEGLTDRIHEHCAAVAVTDANNAATVQLQMDVAVDCAAVVVAANAWIDELLPGSGVRPVRAQMLAAPCADVLVDRPTYAEWGHRYWRQLGGGTVLVGGFRHRALQTEVGYNCTPSELVQRHLDDQLRSLGVSSTASHRWAGTMGFSLDGLPLVGRVPGMRRIHVCGGYTGHGMGFAMNATRALSRALLDAQPLPHWLDPNREVAAADLTRPASLRAIPDGTPGHS